MICVRSPNSCLNSLLARFCNADSVSGDIKPANVLLRPNGADLGEGFTALYCDFSSSCILDGPSGEGSEQIQQLTAVTADFASPELLSSLSNISALATTASDIYALAVSLAVAATGSSPYAGASMELHKLGMIREGRVLDFARLGEQGTRVMKGRLVERCLRHALEKDVTKRSTVEELRRNVEATVEELR